MCNVGQGTVLRSGTGDSFLIRETPWLSRKMNWTKYDRCCMMCSAVGANDTAEF